MYVCMQVPLFQNTEIGFTKLLALSIEPRLFLSKEYIVKKGDIGSEVTHTVLCVMYSAVAIYSPMLLVAVSDIYILYMFPPSPSFQMFFINRGTVDVVSEDGSVVFATMTEGKFFGEISLVFSCPRTASIRFVSIRTYLTSNIPYVLYVTVRESESREQGNTSTALLF